MSRIHRERRKDRKHLRLEIRVHALALVVIEQGHRHQFDALLLERRQYQLMQRLVSALQQLMHPHADGLELLRRRQRIGRILPRARRDFPPQPRHPDHVELVQVRAEDREELEPLQQRHARVERFLEHARIEIEPTQLAIQVRQRQGGRRRDGGCPARCAAPDRREIRLD